MAFVLSLIVDPSFGIHSHKPSGTAQLYIFWNEIENFFLSFNIKGKVQDF